MQGAHCKGGVEVRRSAGLIKGPLSNLGHGPVSKIRYWWKSGLEHGERIWLTFRETIMH